MPEDHRNVSTGPTAADAFPHQPEPGRDSASTTTDDSPQNQENASSIHINTNHADSNRIYRRHHQQRMTIPLMAIFLLQLAVVTAAFVAVTTFLLIANLHATDDGVISTLTAQLRAGHELFVAPMEEHGRTARSLALTLRALNATMPGPTTLAADDTPNVTENVVTAWKVMRVASNTSSQTAYAYGLSCVNFTTSTGDCAVWMEMGCNQEVCYATRNFNSTFVHVDPDDPSGPIVLDGETLQETYSTSLADEYYVQFVRNITTQFAWSSAYFWGEYASSVWGGSTIYLTGYYCIAFHPEFGGCMNAFALDLNVSFAQVFLQQLVTEAGATASVIDLEADTLLIATGSGIDRPVLNNGALWSAREAPVEGVAEGLAAYHTCARRQPDAAQACSMVILNEFPSVVVAIQPVTAVLQVDHASTIGVAATPRFLLVKVVPRASYYDHSDATFRASLATVIVVCTAATALSVVIFCGIAAPVKQLVVNFQHASALENEKVEPAHSIISEMAALNGEFLLLNQRLTTARAFLPLSILINGGLQPLLPADSETLEAMVCKASMQRPVMHSQSADDAEEEEEACNPLSLDVTTMDLPEPQHHRPENVGGVDANPLPPPLDRDAAAVGCENPPPRGHHRHAPPNPNRGVLSNVLHNRNVAVISANMIAFEVALQDAPKHAMSIHAAVLQQLIASVQRSGGVMDSFHGDLFLITFNASSACPNPGCRAVETMVHALEELDKRADLKMVPANRPRGGSATSNSNCRFLGLRLGVASGQAICGNLGDNRVQRFSVVGRCVSDAFALMQLARFEDLTNVVSATVVRALNSQQQPASSEASSSRRSTTVVSSVSPFKSPAVHVGAASTPTGNDNSSESAEGGGFVFFHMFHGVLPKAKEPVTMSTILGRVQTAEPHRLGMLPPRHHAMSPSAPCVGYDPLPARPVDAAADRGGAAECTRKHPNAFTPPPPLQVVRANNEAFQLFVAGKFTQCRQMAHHIPAPADYYIQRTLRVAHISAAVHEW